MRLSRRPEPFDHKDWIYEIKFDGFRALAYIEDGKCRLVSRRRHEYKSFRQLQAAIATLPVKDAVIDGEIVCLDPLGRSLFYDLMFRRGAPYFYAFDLLWLNGEDLRGLPLIDRKKRLAGILKRKDRFAKRLPNSERQSDHSLRRILYLDHLETNGSGLFAKACELDLEGIVAKWAPGKYEASNRRSSWVKIKNRNYSQLEGREELFQVR
jgi:bifunctional non-homologous end joining protein LigD